MMKTGLDKPAGKQVTDWDDGPDTATDALAQKLRLDDLIAVKVDVTAEDIAEGVRHSSTSCPLARAIRRCNPGVPVAVFNFAARIGGKLVELPDSLVVFRCRFDHGETVEPVSFYLEGV